LENQKEDRLKKYRIEENQKEDRLMKFRIEEIISLLIFCYSACHVSFWIDLLLSTWFSLFVNLGVLRILL
jgi:hypothetical protein